MVSRALCPPKWKSGDLYLFLVESFPEHRTPFNRLDVDRLANDIGKSYESLYKKLRKGQLNVKWAKLLCEFANDENRLIASAEKYARTTTETLHAYLETTPEKQAEIMENAVVEATNAVRKRFAENREPLTLEQDFIDFFI